MSIWDILGIEKTKDLEALKNAYRQKLSVTNPEDDPEGFKKLRGAYEQAVEYASGEDEGAVPDTPAGKWITRVKEVYDDFPKRIDEGCWDELLTDDACVALGMADETIEALFVFFTENHNLPQRIWKKLVDFFEIAQRKEELTEKYPRGFIDHILDCAKYSERLDYYLFDRYEKGLPYDEFIETYLELSSTVIADERDKFTDLLAKLKAMPMSHPFEALQEIRLYADDGDYSSAEELADSLVKKYPDLIIARQLSGELRLRQDKFEDSYRIYSEILKEKPDNYAAKRGVADSLLGQGDAEAAKKLYKELLLADRFDFMTDNMIVVCNNKLIPEYSEKLEKNPDDFKTRIELIWCYYQNLDLENAYKLLNTEAPDNILKLDLTYLKARCVLQDKKLDEAAGYFEEYLRLFPQYKDEDSEEGKQNREREGLVYFFLAEIMIEKDDFKKAIVYNDSSIEKASLDKGMILSQRGRILMELERYKDAEDAERESLEIEPGNFESYYILGCIFEKQEIYDEAFDNYERALDIFPYYVKAHGAVIRLYMDLNNYDEAEKATERLRELMPESCQSLLYMSQIYREKDDMKTADKYLGELTKQLEEKPNENDIDRMDLYWYELAISAYYSGNDTDLSETIKNIKKAVKLKPCGQYYYFLGNIYLELESYEDAIKAFKDCLRVGGEHPGVYFKLAGIYGELNEPDELRMLDKVIELQPNHPEAHGRRGAILESIGKMEEAYEEYSKQLSINPSGYYYVAKGLLDFEAGRNDEAVKNFDSALEGKDNDSYAYYNKGRVYLALGRLEEAESLFEKAIKASERMVFVFYKGLAETLSRMGKRDKAIEVLKELIVNDVNTASSLYYLCCVLKSDGNYKQALSVAKNALKKNRGVGFESIISELYIDCFEDCKKAERFLKDAGRKLESGELLSDYAYLYRELGDIESEYAVRKKMIEEMNEDSAVEYLRLSVVAGKMSRRKGISTLEREAYEAECKKYSELSVEAAKAAANNYEGRAYELKTLAAAYIEMGDYEKAKEVLDLLSKTQMCDYCFETECYDYWYQLARYYQKTGQIELAGKAIQRACSVAPDDKQCRDLAKEISKQ